jgi:hypothetical protein
MDLNYLYYRQQVEVFLADNAACLSSRVAHRDLAERYTKLIESRKTDALEAA